MSERDQRCLVFHGAIIFMAANLAGLPFAQAISEGWGEEAVRAWRVAHTGLASAGLMLLAVGAVLRHVLLGPGEGRLLRWAFLAAGYASLGLVVGAAAGVRGLQPVGPAANLLVVASNSVLGLGALVGTMFLIRGAWAGYRAVR
jgi:hypothetical protein